MKIGLTITDSVGQLEKAIMLEIKSALNKAILGAIPDIKIKVGVFVRQLVINTPEFDSLLSGRLKVELGLKDPSLPLNQILYALENGITVDYSGLKASSSGISGGFTIGLVKDRFAELTSLSGASYVSNNKTIPWLEWLLFQGDTMVISDYEIKYSYSQESRTHSALMIKGTKGWRVPPEFSGTENNNFITRAFEDDSSTERVIGKIVENEITRRLV